MLHLLGQTFLRRGSEMPKMLCGGVMRWRKGREVVKAEDGAEGDQSHPSQTAHLELLLQLVDERRLQSEDAVGVGLVLAREAPRYGQRKKKKEQHIETKGMDLFHTNKGKDGHQGAARLQREANKAAAVLEVNDIAVRVAVKGLRR
jgi:hypothetical protein